MILPACHSSITQHPREGILRAAAIGALATHAPAIECKAKTAVRDARHQHWFSSSSHVLPKLWVEKSANIVALHRVFAKVLGIDDGSNPSVPKYITNVFPIFRHLQSRQMTNYSPLALP